MTKTSTKTSKTDRFLKLISTKPTTAKAAASRLKTSVQTVYDMVYRLRNEGNDITRVDGRYTI